MKKAVVTLITLLACFQLNEANQQENNISLELKKMYEADQEERILLYSVKFDPFQLHINDSIRLARVIEIDRNNLLHTITDKYYAAWIYHHGGGPGMKDDSLYTLRAISLLEEILNSPTDEILIDTVNLAEIKGNGYYELFRTIPMKHIKIDTIIFISSNKEDTSLVVYSSVIERAKSLKSLAEQQLGLQRGKRKDSAPSINLNQIEDPEYQKLVREIIKRRIKTQGSSLQLTEEQINSLVDEQIKSLINMKKAYIKSIEQDTTK